jgi:hypothetical protein
MVIVMASLTLVRQRLKPDMALVTPGLSSLFDCLESVTSKLLESCFVQWTMQIDITASCIPKPKQQSLSLMRGGNGLIPAVSKTDRIALRLFTANRFASKVTSKASTIFTVSFFVWLGDVSASQAVRGPAVVQIMGHYYQRLLRTCEQASSSVAYPIQDIECL